MGRVREGFVPDRKVPLMSDSDERFPVRRKIRLPGSGYREGHCFFITIGTDKRYRWFSHHRVLGDELVNILNRTAAERHTLLFAWCVMPDHVHLLALDRDIVDLVRLLKGRATPLARHIEPQRRLWKRSFYDHGLRHEESVERVAQYIFENPVRKNLARAPPDYPWSGSNVWPDWCSLYD